MEGFITESVEPLVWFAVFLLLTAAVVFIGVQKGIEKASTILMPMLIVAMLTCIFIGYIAKPKTIIDEVELGGKTFKEKKFYVVMLKYVAPVCLLLILLFAVSEALGLIKV